MSAQRQDQGRRLAAPDIDVEAWFVRAQEQGVVFQSEKQFRHDGAAGQHTPSR